MFYFSIATTEPIPKLTKHIVLSSTSKLFDPLGWLAPVVITAEMLLQFLWQSKKGSNDEVDNLVKLGERVYRSKLAQISTLEWLLTFD